jgi:hypothetical protein
MKLTYIILSVVALTKSLAVPFNSQDSVELAMPAKYAKSCFKSRTKEYSLNDISKINRLLSHAKGRYPIFLNNDFTVNKSCGAIVNLSRRNTVKISNDFIPKLDCNKTIICSGISNCTNAAYCSSDDHAQVNYNEHDQYQLSLINNTSADYGQTLKSCNVTYPDNTKCFKLERISHSGGKAENNSATTQLATGLASALYLYFLGIASCIHISYTGH